MAKENKLYAIHKNFKSEYFTNHLNYNNSDNDIVNTISTKQSNFAALCGDYFEVIVYDELVRLAETIGGRGGRKADAKNIQVAKSFETSTDPEVLKVGADIRKIGHSVAKTWFDNLKKNIEKVTGEEITSESKIKLKIDAIGTIRGKGNPLGDIRIILPKKLMDALKLTGPIVLELKWQTDQATTLEYFHSVSEKMLFNGAFKNHLTQGNWPEINWVNDWKQPEWADKISIALFDFLTGIRPEPGKLLLYLLQKGEMRNRRGKKFGERQLVRGTSASYTIADMESFARGIAKTMGEKGTIEGIGGKQNVKKASIYFFDEERSPIARFYLNEVYSNSFNNQDKNTQSPKTKIEEANFAFGMYVSTKVFASNYFK